MSLITNSDKGVTTIGIAKHLKLSLHFVKQVLEKNKERLARDNYARWTIK